MPLVNIDKAYKPVDIIDAFVQKYINKSDYFTEKSVTLYVHCSLCIVVNTYYDEKEYSFYNQSNLRHGEQRCYPLAY